MFPSILSEEIVHKVIKLEGSPGTAGNPASSFARFRAFLTASVLRSGEVAGSDVASGVKDRYLISPLPLSTLERLAIFTVE